MAFKALFSLFLHKNILSLEKYDLHHEKTNILVSDLVRHKPGCTATEVGERFEISDLERRGIFVFFFANTKHCFSHDAVRLICL